MRLVVIASFVLAAAACDLRPAPKPAPRREAPEPIERSGSAGPRSAPEGERGASIDAAEVPAPVASIDAAAVAEADAGVEASPDCVQTAQQIANVVIDGADASVRGHYEQGRANMVRVIAAACTTQGWNADRQQCFRLAKVDADIRACEAKYPMPH